MFSHIHVPSTTPGPAWGTLPHTFQLGKQASIVTNYADINNKKKEKRLPLHGLTLNIRGMGQIMLMNARSCPPARANCKACYMSVRNGACATEIL